MWHECKSPCLVDTDSDVWRKIIGEEYVLSYWPFSVLCPLYPLSSSGLDLEESRELLEAEGTEAPSPSQEQPNTWPYAPLPPLPDEACPWFHKGGANMDPLTSQKFPEAHIWYFFTFVLTQCLIYFEVAITNHCTYFLLCTLTELSYLILEYMPVLHCSCMSFTCVFFPPYTFNLS